MAERMRNARVWEIIPGVTKHARERMEERFGRDLPTDAWLELVAAIIDRRAVLMRRTGHTEEYRVDLRGLVIEAAWCPDAATVVSVKDPDAMGASAAADSARAGKLRAAGRVQAHYRKGKFIREKTEWRK